MPVKKFSHRMAIIFFLSTIIPLTVLGILATALSYQASRKNIVQRNDRISVAAAEQVDLYLKQEINLLNTLAQNIERTALQKWQKEAILKNYVNRFPSLLSIALIDKHGKLYTSSEIDTAARLNYASDLGYQQAKSSGKVHFSSLVLNDTLLPTLQVSVPIQYQGQVESVLIGTVNIIDLWNLIDSLGVGTAGYCLIIDNQRQLIAHGDARGKTLVLEKYKIDTHLNGTNLWHERVLQSKAPIPTTDWQVIIEQPLSEAFAGARKIVGLTLTLAFLVLSASVVVGYLGGRRIVHTVESLMEATRRLASGNLDYKVSVDGKDELARLGDAFNRMGDDLTRLQKEVATRERLSTFGRVAAALAHDLKHPINNIRVNSSLLQEKYHDSNYRKIFIEVIERELSSLNYLVMQLRDLAQKRDLIKIPLDIFDEIKQIVASMQPELTSKKIKVVLIESPLPFYILGDMLSIRRLISNILRNAVEAIDPGNGTKTTAPEIKIQATEDMSSAQVVIVFRDNGCGIAAEQLSTIFEEFRSTKTESKERGLGLGMPIIQQICREHAGSVDIRSQVGIGTEVIVRLPIAKGAVTQLHQVQENKI